MPVINSPKSPNQIFKKKQSRDNSLKEVRKFAELENLLKKERKKTFRENLSSAGGVRTPYLGSA